MLRKLALAAVVATVACSDDGVTNVEDVDAGVDVGNQVRPDAGFVDTGPRPDLGFPDTGPRPDAGPPPPDEVQVSGRVVRFGDYLAGNNVYVDQAAVVAYGVLPQTSVISGNNPPGAYQVTLPANGQALMVTTKAGYNQTFYSVTTNDQPYPDRTLYIAEAAWLSEIANAHNVNLANEFACQTQSLAGQNCFYAALVGRILDDGTAGNGQIRPVADVTADNFTIYGPGNEQWYTRGPYFLDYDGTSSVDAPGSIVFNDNGNYRGGLYVTFAEVPSRGPQSTAIQLSITYPYQGVNRYFGPVTVQAFRSPGASVQVVDLRENGAPPPPPIDGVDFDTQVYPLFLAVNEGGLGCVGCHTNQGGAEPAAGMNLYGGPTEAYASLDPNQYPQRVNVENPTASYLLVRPLFEADGNQDHPIFAFASPQDPGYQLILTWITEGGLRNNNNLPPVSFYNDIRPLLYQPTNNGGAGCYTCHVDGVDETNAPGNFYMGGNGNELYDRITNVAPNNPGPYDEAYRINKQGYPERSLLLTNPLFGDAEPHPVKIFFDAADPRYQLIYRWVAEGYNNDTP